MFSLLRVARGGVSVDALVEAEAAEQPEGRGEILFAVQPLLLDRPALFGEQSRNIATRKLFGLLDIGVGHGCSSNLRRSLRPGTDSTLALRPGPLKRRTPAPPP